MKKYCIKQYGFVADPKQTIRQNVLNFFYEQPHTYFTDKITNSAFHNLAPGISLPYGTKSLLGKGMKFCIRTPLPRHNINSTITRLQRSVRLRQWLIETERLDENDGYNKKLYIKSKWPPPKTNPTLEFRMRQFRDNLQTELATIKSSSRRSANLNDMELQALKQNRKRKDIIFLQADKGLGPVVMPRPAYKKAILKMLSDKDSYKEITKEEAHNILRQAKSDLHDLFKYDGGYSLAENEITYIAAALNILQYRMPRLHGMPKLHKDDDELKFRPVTDMFESLLSYFSKWLSEHIKSLLKFLPTQVRDSQHFIEHLIALGKLPWYARLFTADAVAMYTNINLDDALKNIENWLKYFAHELPNSFPNQKLFLAVLKIVMSNSVFQFGEQYFLQTQGTAMGTPCAGD